MVIIKTKIDKITTQKVKLAYFSWFLYPFFAQEILQNKLISLLFRKSFAYSLSENLWNLWKPLKSINNYAKVKFVYLMFSVFWTDHMSFYWRYLPHKLIFFTIPSNFQPIPWLKKYRVSFYIQLYCHNLQLIVVFCSALLCSLVFCCVLWSFVLFCSKNLTTQPQVLKHGSSQAILMTRKRKTENNKVLAILNWRHVEFHELARI